MQNPKKSWENIAQQGAVSSRQQWNCTAAVEETVYTQLSLTFILFNDGSSSASKTERMPELDVFPG